ncbi:hypothetical protein R50076_21650 [Gilvimarinus japonicus]
MRKHRHAMDGVSMRPPKIGRSEGTRRAEVPGWPLTCTDALMQRAHGAQELPFGYFALAT